MELTSLTESRDNALMTNRPTLLMIAPENFAAALAPKLTEALPELDVRIDRPEDDAPRAEFALAALPPKGRLAKVRDLKCVITPGAGVDYLLVDETFPRHVKLARLSQPDLVQRMMEYVVLHVLRHHRHMFDYDAHERARRWVPNWTQKNAHERTVGILGLGVIGAFAARALSNLGFKVRGWARSPKDIAGVASFAGDAALPGFLKEVEILVNLLPLTPATRGLLNARTFAMLPKGASIINAGRGPSLVEADILDALDSGHLDSATLDVFETEPLPAESRFWTHPRVTVTPHCAGWITPAAIAPHIMDAIKAVLAGRDPPQMVDFARGY